MNVSEAGMILGLCAAFDNRTPNEASMEAWAAALYDVPYPDAQQAVKDHYRTTRQWAMPADIRNLAVSIANDRADRRQADELRAIEAALPKRPVNRIVELLAEAMDWTPEQRDEQASYRSALQIPCPVVWCQAKESERCRTAHRRLTANPHPSRIEKSKADA